MNSEWLQSASAAPSPSRLAITLPDFQQVFADSHRFVWRVLARMGVPNADLPDVCQEVFLVVHRRLADYDGRASLRSWIYGICVRTASDYRRRKRVRPERLHDEVPDVAVPAEQDRDMERKRARGDLQHALEQLDENKRAVFILYEIEELSMSEVAEALTIPLQTAYSRLHAARKVVTSVFQRLNATRGVR